MCLFMLFNSDAVNYVPCICLIKRWFKGNFGRMKYVDTFTDLLELRSDIAVSSEKWCVFLFKKDEFFCEMTLILLSLLQWRYRQL
jgi:hypothetical protein